jgi:hypothetical protein
VVVIVVVVVVVVGLTKNMRLTAIGTFGSVPPASESLRLR